MREKCQVPPLCYDFSNVGKYLAQPDVVSYLGVQGHKWTDCNHAVAVEFELAGDWMHNYQTQIPDQLADGIRVLLYVYQHSRFLLRGVRVMGRHRFSPLDATVLLFRYAGDQGL